MFRPREWLRRGRTGWVRILLIFILAFSTLPWPASIAQAATPPVVVGWGSNYYGEATAPPGLSNVVAIAASGAHSLAVKSDGTVVGWGWNQYGQATVPDGLSNVVAIAAGWAHSLALKSDGTVVGWGYNYSGQATTPPGLSNVVAIAAGGAHSLALKSDGTVVGWGANFYGQSTAPPGLSNVVAIAAGYMHSLALKSDGTVVGWGWNQDGQATVPDRLSDVVAIAAGWLHSLALKSDGTVVGWGSNDYDEAAAPPGLSNVVAIAAGWEDSLALKSDGTVVGWGDNYSGQATAPDGLSNVVAIAAGSVHSLALIAVAPTVTTQPDSQIVSAGSNASFSAAASGDPAPTVRWQVSTDNGSTWNDIPGESGTTLSFTAGPSDDGKQYRAVFTNSRGSTPSSAASLAITDASPPEITATVEGVLGKDSWYVSDVSVTWTVTDAGSLLTGQAGCDPADVTHDTPNITFTCTATSTGGVSTQSVTVKRDATPPTNVIGIPAVSPDESGFYLAPVTVQFSGSDATSGIAGCSSVTYAGAANASVALLGTCMDNAGNIASGVTSFTTVNHLYLPAVEK